MSRVASSLPVLIASLGSKRPATSGLSCMHVKQLANQPKGITMAEKEKVVLAYSGGLDTSVIVKWLQVEKNLDVIAICGNVGQDEKDLSWIKQKALDMGAIASEALDMRAEYAEKILSKAIWANGKYEGVYPLLSALSRPLISKHLVDIADLQAPRGHRAPVRRQVHRPRLHRQGQRPGAL